MNRRIETYIILGAYFFMGIVAGYAIGKGEVKNSKSSVSIRKYKNFEIDK